MAELLPRGSQQMGCSTSEMRRVTDRATRFVAERPHPPCGIHLAREGRLARARSPPLDAHSVNGACDADRASNAVIGTYQKGDRSQRVTLAYVR